MTPFLITGLPRSRTAWWAVVTGAIHEPRSHEIPWAGGISDSRLALHLPTIFARFEPRTLIVERDAASVLRSFKGYIGPLACDWRATGAMIERNLDALQFEHPAIKRVAYAALSKIDTVRECMDWLRVTEPPHLAQLMHMNIQSDLRFNLDRMKDAA